MDADSDIAALEREIASLRGRTESVVLTLEQRFRRGRAEVTHVAHEARQLIDVRRQLREHPIATSGVLAGLATAAALAIRFGIRHWRREQRWPRRVRHRLDGYRTILADPERVLHKREPLGRELLGAVAVTAAGIAVRTIGERLLARSTR
jgi:hypothetical protein